MLGSLKGQAMGAAKGAAGEGMNNPSTKRNVFYLLVAVIVGGAIGLTALLARTNPNQAFLIAMISFLTAGIIHVWAMYSIFPWAGKYNFSKECWFTLLVNVLLLLGFVLCFFFLNRPSALMFSAASVLFFVPLLIHCAVNFATDIPPKDYKKWIYPDKPIVTDFENIDTTNMAVITFIFSKKEGDKTLSNFQSKAPYAFRLGDLFYFYVQEWNHKNPGNTIQYVDENSKSFGWYFFVKKTWWKPKKYLDADFTIRENKINVNEIIVTERIKLQ